MIEIAIAVFQHIWLRSYSFGDGSQADLLSYEPTGPHCASDIADLQGGCVISWDTFFCDFLIMHPLIHCHSTCEIDFNTIEPALFAQSASGYFSFSSGQRYWFRLKFRPSYGWGFRRYTHINSPRLLGTTLYTWIVVWILPAPRDILADVGSSSQSISAAWALTRENHASFLANSCFLMNKLYIHIYIYI